MKLGAYQSNIDNLLSMLTHWLQFMAKNELKLKMMKMS